ncbi:MAG: hypothetical protein K6F69_00720 [Treponema sp.]|nr:hypothetical protein [Treponema sp.]
MTQIRPITDLKEHLDEVERLAKKAPVFLTEDGGNTYVLMNMADYRKLNGTPAEKVPREKVAKLRQLGWSITEIARSFRTTEDEISLILNEQPKAR